MTERPRKLFKVVPHNEEAGYSPGNLGSSSSLQNSRRLLWRLVFYKYTNKNIQNEKGEKSC